MDEYSAAEMRLIHHFGFSDISPRVFAVELYRMMALKAFKDGKNDAHVDALRRCLLAMESCRVYRGTPEWDELARIY